MIEPQQLIALDTNVLVNWLRNNSTGQYLKEQYQLDTRVEKPLFSTVVEGELLGLARRWQWGEERLKQLAKLLDELVRFNSGMPAVVEAYAELYFQSSSTGHTTGENDLWIAASARAAGAVLLTNDNGFSWMHPNLVRIELVPNIP